MALALQRVSIGEGLPMHRQCRPWVPGPRSYIRLLTLVQAQGPQVLCCCRDIFSGCSCSSWARQLSGEIGEREEDQTEDRERKRGGGGRDSRL